MDPIQQTQEKVSSLEAQIGQMMTLLQQSLQQQQQQQQHLFAAQQQQQQQQAAASRSGDLDLLEGSSSEEDLARWDEVFEAFSMESVPQSPAAQQFVQRLAVPPPLKVLKQSESQVERDRGIPQTPA